MDIIGHRGAAAVAAENTVAGVRRAFADGADAVEVDCRLTADGEVVIVHDETLERIAGGPIPGGAAPIAASTLAALRAVAPVATLGEIWDAAAGRVVLELKGAWGSDQASRVARAVAAFLGGRDTAAAVVSSFDLLALAAFREAGGAAATGVLTVEAVDPASNIAAAVEGGHAVCYVPGAVTGAAVVRQAHAAGKRLVAWTVNDPARIRALAEAGADGVITDDPAAARAALAGG